MEVREKQVGRLEEKVVSEEERNLRKFIHQKSIIYAGVHNSNGRPRKMVVDYKNVKKKN